VEALRRWAPVAAEVRRQPVPCPKQRVSEGFGFAVRLRPPQTVCGSQGGANRIREGVGQQGGAAQRQGPEVFSGGILWESDGYLRKPGLKEQAPPVIQAPVPVVGTRWVVDSGGKVCVANRGALCRLEGRG